MPGDTETPAQTCGRANHGTHTVPSVTARARSRTESLTAGGGGSRGVLAAQKASPRDTRAPGLRRDCAVTHTRSLGVELERVTPRRVCGAEG